MENNWIQISKNLFDEFKLSFEKKVSDVVFIKAVAIADKKGAFVEIRNREEAKLNFLHETVVYYSDRLIQSYEECLKMNYSQAVFVTAESKTADIEKKLVSGVHGPEECYFVILQ